MYYRLGTIRFDIPRRDDAMSGVIRAAMNSLSNALVTDDTAAMLAWFDAQDKACSGPVGCVGHCMSGCYITTVAARFPHRIKVAASLYGVNIVTDKSDSSHLLLPQVKGELYYAFAEHDQSVPEHVMPDLRAALVKTDVANTVTVFPGTHHGFCFAERAAYDPQAAEQTWSDIFALWQSRLANSAVDKPLAPAARIATIIDPALIDPNVSPSIHRHKLGLFAPRDSRQ